MVDGNEFQNNGLQRRTRAEDLQKFFDFLERVRVGEDHHLAGFVSCDDARCGCPPASNRRFLRTARALRRSTGQQRLEDRSQLIQIRPRRKIFVDPYLTLIIVDVKLVKEFRDLFHLLRRRFDDQKLAEFDDRDRSGGRSFGGAAFCPALPARTGRLGGRPARGAPPLRKQRLDRADQFRRIGVLDFEGVLDGLDGNVELFQEQANRDEILFTGTREDNLPIRGLESDLVDLTGEQ